MGSSCGSSDSDEYIDYTSEDIIEINNEIITKISGCNKNTLIIYNITPDTVHKLVIPPGIENLSILGYHLDHFDIPEGIIDVRLGSLGLKTIYIPEGVKHVFCSRNFLKTIEIPKSLESLVAHHNILSDITFRSSPNKLNHLDIRCNKITHLELDSNMELKQIKYFTPELKTFLNINMDYSCKASYNNDEFWNEYFIY